MEDKQYYTPNIDEIYVGFECEIKNYPYLFDRGFCFECKETEDNWYKGELDFNTMNFLFSDRNWNKTWIRVPYLTRKQLEDEGWDFTDEGFRYYGLQKGMYKMQFLYDKHAMYIIDLSTGELGEPDCIYKGFCPSINEFKKICKLLNI